MNCPKCGQPVKEGAPFCGNCGTPIEQAPAWETQEQNNAQAAQPAASASGFQYQPPAAPQPVSQPSVSSAPNAANVQTFPGSAPSQPQIGQVPGTQTPIDFSQVINNGALPPQPPKKKNTGLIVGIVIGVVAAVVIGIVVLAIIGYNVQKKEAETTTAAPAAEITTQQPNGFAPATTAAPGDDSTTKTQYGFDFTPATTAAPAAGSTGTAYTKGSVSNGEYSNAWANLRIAIPDGWTEDDEQGYREWEDDAGDCGFACSSPDSDSFVIMFFDADPGDTAEEYRDLFDKNAAEGSTPMKGKPVHSDATIRDDKYLCSDIVFENGVAESMYFRILDDKLIVIFLIGHSIDDNDAVMETIRGY